MKKRATIEPRSVLRRAGIAGLVAGPLLLAVGIAGLSMAQWTTTVPGQSTSSAYVRVFFVAIAVCGAIEFAAGVVGWRASSRLPDVARLAGVNDFLTFVTAIVTFMGMVFLTVLGYAPAALVVAILGAGVLYSSVVSRKAMAAAGHTVNAP
ncbi:hypothetical protein [Demequina aurantiaca]|uniref:hypothetical protein n=1 Tax=Demequina aurantiaca TaxID=676200 RepID=UPI003D328F0F